jgi:iron complex transport system ATP-binding protein
MKEILKVEGLTLRQGHRPLVNSLHLQGSASDIIAVIGENGAGKTSILKALAGLTAIAPRRVWLHQKDLSDTLPMERAQKISFLLQETPLQPYCLAQNRIAHGLTPFVGFQAPTSKEFGERIHTVAHNLGIAHLLSRRLMCMSGGEQRLVYLAKTLINLKAPLILLDEPTAFLDFKQRANLQEVLLKRAQLGSLIIFSSHDEGFIRGFATRILQVKDQQVIEKPTSSNCIF